MSPFCPVSLSGSTPVRGHRFVLRQGGAAAHGRVDLGAANIATQQVLDANQNSIGNWLAHPATGNRLVVSVSKPLTSPQLVPIGIVLERDSVPLPGNGARVVL